MWYTVRKAVAAGPEPPHTILQQLITRYRPHYNGGTEERGLAVGGSRPRRARVLDKLKI